MNTLQSMHEAFERKKNMKAAGLTILVTGALFLFLFLVSWTIPIPPAAPIDEGIEVNLGNSETGLGDIPPQIPGELSAETDNVAQPQPSTPAVAESKQELTANDEPDAPVISSTKKTDTKKQPNNIDNSTAKKSTNTQPIATPPKPAKPKAVYAGGKSDGGGNNADSYNNVRNQGIAGGTGDQGKPNGNPNSDSYTGNGGTGTSGVVIRDGLTGRKPVGATRFEDTYKYGGTVLVNVTVDENGKVIAASLKQGSPFPDINKIAIKRAWELKFSKGSEVQTGTVQIKFENPKG